MSEENIINNEVENTDDTSSETEIIQTEDIEVIEVSSDEAFSPLGEPNSELRHTLLNDRDLADQHPISAITGLRNELNAIEMLQIVYSNQKGNADYYEWENDNLLQDNRVGYFVSLCDNNRTIRLCEGEDSFGVTVDAAAFIGGQDDVKRDYHYGLVVSFGVANVRCESNVKVGDCVVSNLYGIAKKADVNCGYKVVSLQKMNGVLYATIIVGTSSQVICNIGNKVNSIENRVDSAEKNITTAVNVANQAYNKAQETTSISEEALLSALHAMDIADEAFTNTNDISETISSINQTSAEAKAIAETAATSAETLRSQAVSTANEALSEVNQLITDLKPITKWTDVDSGNAGAEYFIEHINNNLATKTEVLTVENSTEKALLAISRNAKNIKSLLASINKYSVGERSQAYGLSIEEIKTILEIGMIYVPTEEHSESYQTLTQAFTPEYYYTWNGSRWIESSTPSVSFSDSYISGNSNSLYWYIPGNEDVSYNDYTYEAHALYLWENNEWVAVATLSGNVDNRKTALINQNIDSIDLALTNARGSISDISAKLDEDGAKISLVASVITDMKDIEPIGIYNTVNNLPSSANDGEYCCVGTSAPYDVYKWNNTNSKFENQPFIYYDGANFCKVNTASIINSVNNDGDTSISLNADKINFVSKAFNIFPTDENGVIVSDVPNFAVDSNGNVSIRGTAYANAGEIGGWSIDSSKIWTGSMSTASGRVFLGPNINSSYTIAGKTATNWVFGVGDKFGVTKTGGLYCTDAHITGDIIASGVKVLTTADTLLLDATNNSVKIANFYCTENSFFANASGSSTWSSNGVFMCTGTESSWSIGGSESINGWCFGAGGNFGVTKAGALYCTDAHITGAINATSGTFAESCKIQGSLYSGFMGSPEYLKWKFDSEGNVIESPTGVTTYSYILFGNAEPNVTIEPFRAPQSKNGLHIESIAEPHYDIKSDLYFDLYDKPTPSDSTQQAFKIGLGCTVHPYWTGSSNDVFSWYGITIDNGDIDIEGNKSISLISSGDTTIDVTYGITLISGLSMNLKSNNIYLTPKASGGCGYLKNTWNADSAIAVTSDENAKNSIENMPDKYSAFFDKLQPKIYKYNNGTSDRYHTGFTAQGVKLALDEANIPTSDFAGLCIPDESDASQTWSLRYEEFISLNTYEIQKLKAEVKQLKEIINNIQN